MVLGLSKYILNPIKRKHNFYLYTYSGFYWSAGPLVNINNIGNDIQIIINVKIVKNLMKKKLVHLADLYLELQIRNKYFLTIIVKFTLFHY